MCNCDTRQSLRDPRLAPNAIYFVAVERKPSGVALEILRKNPAACADTAKKNTKVDGIGLAPTAHKADCRQHSRLFEVTGLLKNLLVADKRDAATVGRP